jgi:hypothetical protein
VTALHTLEGILAALDDAIPEEPPAAIVHLLDQQGARAADELAEYFGVDLADDETARVVGATVIYLTNRGRELSGRQIPVTVTEALHNWQGINRGLYGVCGEIRQRHGKAKGEAAQ